MRAALAAMLLSLLPAASYADEGELQLSLPPTYSMFGRDFREDAHGAGASLDVWLGLAPAAWIFIGGDIQLVEAAIALDVVGDQTYPVLRAGLGADYLITPELAVGIAGGQRFFFGEQGERLLTLGLRVTWRVEID